MEPLRISFLLRSTYDLLPIPTPTNLKQLVIINDNIYCACNQTPATLDYVVKACNKSLQKYTWRHNKVLNFPCHIAMTTVHPDITIWSHSHKCVYKVELTVP